MATTHTENYVLGRGEIWLKADGDSGYRFLGNAPAFNLNITSEKLEHFRSTNGTREKDETIILQTNRTATITLEDISQENLALYFLGEASVVAQTSATALTETFNDVKKGYMYQVGVSPSNPTGYRNLTTPVLKKGSTPLVSGTDYTIDATRGTFEILSTSVTVVDGDDLTLEFGRGAVSRKQVVSGSNSISGEMKFVSQNAAGGNTDYYMPYVEISPNGEYALISENALQTLPITVDVQTAGNLAAVYMDGQPYAA